MHSQQTDQSQPSRLGARLTAIGQWFVAAFVGLLFLVFLSEQRKLGAPGAPVQSYWVVMALFGVVALALLPPVLRRFPGNWKIVPYLGLLGVLLALGSVLGPLEDAWSKTPAGVAEAKERMAADERLAKESEAEDALRRDRQETEKSLAEAASLQEQLKERVEQLEDCFTTFGHRLPKLEDPFRESLHNSEAFQHVETFAIVPDDEGNNVAMKFRGENGMGAFRLGAVKASVDPETCEVIKVGDPQML